MMFNICHEIFYFCKYEILGKIVFSRFPGKSGNFFPGNGKNDFPGIPGKSGNGNSREQALQMVKTNGFLRRNWYNNFKNLTQNDEVYDYEDTLKVVGQWYPGRFFQFPIRT